MSAALATPLLPVVENSGQDLAKKTVCIKIQRARLGNSRKVSTAQVEVDTDKSLLRVSKRLFDCPEYKAIGNFDAEISRYLESVCLPFEKGIHLCPLPLLQQVDRQLKEFSEKRPELVEAFLSVYPRCARNRPIAIVPCTIRAIFCRSTACVLRSRSRGASLASAYPRNYAKLLLNCGTKNAIKSRS